MKLHKVIQTELTQQVRQLPINRIQKYKVLNQVNKLANPKSEVSRFISPVEEKFGSEIKNLPIEQLQEVQEAITKVVARATSSLPKKLYFQNLKKSAESVFAKLMK